MDDLLTFRAELDEFMRWHPQSPLSHEQLRRFRGLVYYDPNPDLVFVLPVVRFPEEEPLILMETSTGATRPFRRWGQVHFQVEGHEATLTIYSDPDGYVLFLPFRDATNGSETYGAGRYLDSERPGLRWLPDGRLLLDFNYAYNPYCAYSDEYSCPLPPPENWLTVPIRAGEKAFEVQP